MWDMPSMITFPLIKSQIRMNFPMISCLGNKQNNMTAVKDIKQRHFIQLPGYVMLLLLALLSLAVNAQVVPHNLLPPKPNPPRLVNDFADLLSPEEERQLEQKLVAYDDSTSNQILVLTVKTMRGYEADQYATEVGHFWGVGGQGKYDNGVVILVSDGTEEGGKRRYFIATGYG
ncbi:MAG: TPM domain-containing protein, partial [Pedobacter sp.]